MLKDLRKDGLEGQEYGYIDKDGTSWRSPQDYVYIGVLPSCGCGDPASIGKYVKDMLLAHVAMPGADDSSKVWANNRYEDLPTMFFLSWADREGYTEHGTSIRGSWFTPKGIELLADIEEAQRLDAMEEGDPDAIEDDDPGEVSPIEDTAWRERLNLVLKLQEEYLRGPRNPFDRTGSSFVEKQIEFLSAMASIAMKSQPAFGSIETEFPIATAPGETVTYRELEAVDPRQGCDMTGDKVIVRIVRKTEPKAPMTGFHLVPTTVEKVVKTYDFRQWDDFGKRFWEGSLGRLDEDMWKDANQVGQPSGEA